MTGVGLAAFIVTRSEAREGPQPFDPSRHMRQVADLVATVFSDELDSRGRGALREMQFVGRLSPMLGDALSMALFNEFISGHVWVEGGQVIGNVTLQSHRFGRLPLAHQQRGGAALAAAARHRAHVDARVAARGRSAPGQLGRPAGAL